MGKFSQKVQIFIFGASIGLLIASLFFIFKLDNLFSKVSLFESGTKAEVHEEEISKEKTEESKKSDASSNGSLSSSNNSSKNSYVKSDSSFISSKSGYLNTENINYEEEDINVLKEELLSVKNITLKDFDGKQINKSDSTLYVMSGVNAGNKSDLYLIEFWKTPLNSKGYKMTRNRILIYGIKENSDLCVAKINEQYYLKNNTEIYHLNYSPEFKPMEKVNEENILKKLN
jgi:hypothetical protein